MKVQSVNNYTTQYSTNKTQKFDNNPNFGYKVNAFTPSKRQRLGKWLLGRVDAVVGNPNVTLRHLPDTAFDIRGFKRGQVNAIRAHFNTITEKLDSETRNRLQLVVERKGKSISANVSDGNTYMFKHFGYAQSSENPRLNTPQHVITLAFQRYLERMHPGESGSQGVNILPKASTFQVAMA